MQKKIGQLIEDRVKSMNMEVTEFAKRINRERSNVYDIFKRDNINTDLLKKIGQVLDYDFFIHFLEPKTVELIKTSEIVKKSKVFLEIELDEDEIIKLGLEEKVVKILSNRFSNK